MALFLPLCILNASLHCSPFMCVLYEFSCESMYLPMTFNYGIWGEICLSTIHTQCTHLQCTHVIYTPCTRIRSTFPRRRTPSAGPARPTRSMPSPGRRRLARPPPSLRVCLIFSFVSFLSSCFPGSLMLFFPGVFYNIWVGGCCSAPSCLCIAQTLDIPWISLSCPLQCMKNSFYNTPNCTSDSAGKRRYDMKQAGFGGQTKPVFHKKVKTTKKISLKLKCSECQQCHQVRAVLCLFVVMSTRFLY